MFFFELFHFCRKGAIYLYTYCYDISSFKCFFFFFYLFVFFYILFLLLFYTFISLFLFFFNPSWNHLYRGTVRTARDSYWREGPALFSASLSLSVSLSVLSCSLLSRSRPQEISLGEEIPALSLTLIYGFLFFFFFFSSFSLMQTMVTVVPIFEQFFSFSYFWKLSNYF